MASLSICQPKSSSTREEYADLGILVELVGGNVVNRENDLDVALLSLLDERSDLLGSRNVKERLPNLKGRKSDTI